MSKDVKKSRGTNAPEPQTIVELSAVVGIGKVGGADRAECLSTMLRENFHAIGDELRREPIDDAFTLLVLLGLERDKEVSMAEKLMLDLRGQKFSNAGKKGAELRHGSPGGARELRALILEKWATGAYKTKDECAEKEHAGLGMSFSTARRALQNAPAPLSR